MSMNAPKSIAEIDFANLTKRHYTPSPDCWADQILYFLMLDRFSDGREKGGYRDTHNEPVRTGATPLASSDDIGSVPYGQWLSNATGWQGGTLRGLRSKLGYLRRLGVTAIWISPIVEQVHGWVGGGTGDFKHYAYAGYWALDFTRLDKNWGSEADLQALVDAAHARGIRVLVDVVLNHPGYATGDDLVAYLPAVFFDGTGNAFKSFVPPPGRGYQASRATLDQHIRTLFEPAAARAGRRLPEPQPVATGLPQEAAYAKR